MNHTKILGERRLPILCGGIARIGSRVVNVMLRDVSHGGMQLCCGVDEEPHLPVGTLLDVACQLPRTSSPVKLPVRILWTRLATDHRGDDALMIGTEFERLDDRARSTLERFTLGFFESIVIADGDPATREIARRSLETQYDVLEAASAAQVMKLLDEHEVAVLILASRLPDADAKSVLRDVAKQYPGCRAVRMTVTGPEDAELIEELSRLYRIFYSLRRPLRAKELQDVVRGAIAQYWESARRDPEVALSANNAAFSQRLLEATRRLSAQRDLGTASGLAVDAVNELVDADRATCHIYDSISETLRSVGGARGDASRSAIAGVAGYVARTGAGVRIARAAEDPRFERSIDDPDAEGSERLMSVPMLSSDRRTLGVLTAVRNGNRPAFDEKDEARLATLASNFSPAFGQMALQTQIEEAFARERRRDDEDSPFRRAALDAHNAAGYTLARPLQLSPRWVGRAYVLLCAVCVIALVYLFLGTMSEYAIGPAIVRIEGRTDITAIDPGVVESVEVQPGQRVLPQQVLVRLHDNREAMELEKIRSEFELQLVKSLRNPGDVAVRETLARLRTERDFAQNKLEARAIRAPQGGVVNDVRVRPGQSLGVGDPMLSITGARAEPTIVALIPGQYRPMLHAGQSVRLEMNGYRYAYADVELESIGDEIVGPQEARRYLGKEIGDAVALDGPVVLVRAHLPERMFRAEGKLYNYHDGMQARAEVRVRTQRIIARLVPALQGLPWFSAAWNETFDER